MTTMTPIKQVRHERTHAEFADGGSVCLEEADLRHHMTRTVDGLGTETSTPVRPIADLLDLDSEYNYIVVGINWSDPRMGRAILPVDVTRWNSENSDEEWADEYDQVAYIDSAIEALQRARAVLTMQSNSGEQVTA